ncbi:MAG: CDGSH iron-sulfur domain-containing protein [Aquisalimonadaceae bacterium]
MTEKPVVGISESTEEPVIASTTPFRIELLAGYRYAFCACGLSKYQPFCDGSHTSSKAGIKPVIWTQEKDRTVLLCGCKRSARLPFCDSTHEKL